MPGKSAAEKFGDDVKFEYYNESVGSVFVWTTQSLLFSCLVFALYAIVALLDAYEGVYPVLVWWVAVSVLVLSVVVALINGIIAFIQVKPELFPREYMKCTQAYCGMISVISTTFSCTSYKAMSSVTWQKAFFPTEDKYLHVVTVCLIAALNVQWLMSLVLTYVCTPYGKGNLAFLQIPVAAGLALLFTLVNETGTRGLMTCSTATMDVMVFAFANMFILSSALMHVLSALEFDIANKFPSFMHSTAGKRAQFDVYSFIHGTLIVSYLIFYAPNSKFSTSTFVAYSTVVLFTIGVTLIHTFDVYRIICYVFRHGVKAYTRHHKQHVEQGIVVVPEGVPVPSDDGVDYRDVPRKHMLSKRHLRARDVDRIIEKDTAYDVQHHNGNRDKGREQREAGANIDSLDRKHTRGRSHRTKARVQGTLLKDPLLKDQGSDRSRRLVHRKGHVHRSRSESPMRYHMASKLRYSSGEERDSLLGSFSGSLSGSVSDGSQSGSISPRDRMHMQRYATVYNAVRAKSGKALPTAVELFPNIPVTLRRTLE